MATCRGYPTPAIDGDVINLDATLGQQLFNIAIREPVAKIPTYRNHDHIRREPIPSERRRRCWHSGRATTHQPSLPAHGDPPMQQCRLSDSPRGTRLLGLPRRLTHGTG